MTSCNTTVTVLQRTKQNIRTTTETAEVVRIIRTTGGNRIILILTSPKKVVRGLVHINETTYLLGWLLYDG